MARDLEDKRHRLIARSRLGASSLATRTSRKQARRRPTLRTPLRRLQAPAQDFGHNLKPDSPLVAAAQRTLDKASADFKRLQELSEVRAAQWRASSAALQSVEVWLRAGRPGGTSLEAVEVSPPAPSKGEKGLLDQIETRRRRVRELRADLARIAAAPFPSGYCKARMREQVEILAGRGAPDVTALVEHDGDIIWPSQEVRSEVYSEQRALAFATAPDGLALVAASQRSSPRWGARSTPSAKIPPR